MDFHFVQICFCNSLSFFHRNLLLLNISKDFLNLHYKAKCETGLRNFFSLIFQWLQRDVCQCWWHQRVVLLQPCHTDHSDPKGGILFFKFTPTKARVLCFHAHSGYSTRKQLNDVRFFKGLDNYMENENNGNKIKIMIWDFNCTMDKMGRVGKNKT